MSPELCCQLHALGMWMLWIGVFGLAMIAVVHESKNGPVQGKSKGWRPNGFTLVELLTVMSIIAVLAALAISTTGSLWGSAGKSEAGGMIRSIYLASEVYQLENRVGVPSEADGQIGLSVLRCLAPQRITKSGGDRDLLLYDQKRVIDGKLVDPWGQPYFFERNGLLGNSNNAGIPGTLAWWRTEKKMSDQIQIFSCGQGNYKTGNPVISPWIESDRIIYRPDGK